MMPTKEQAITALTLVADPELQLDIWTLGLVYGVECEGKIVKITMTFTSPFCPYGPELVEQVKTELEKIGFTECQVDVVFSPVWKPSEEVKMLLGLG